MWVATSFSVQVGKGIESYTMKRNKCGTHLGMKSNIITLGIMIPQAQSVWGI